MVSYEKFSFYLLVLSSSDVITTNNQTEVHETDFSKFISFKSNFPFISNHVRLSGAQMKSECAIENSVWKIMDIKVLKVKK